MNLPADLNSKPQHDKISEKENHKNDKHVQSKKKQAGLNLA